MPPSEVFAPDLLAGQSALVTGGGTGLGKAAAAELVACGCRVLVAGRRPEVVEAAADELGCEWAAGDVRSPEDAARLVDTALERFARLDVLVNNAGGQYFAPAEAIEAKGWRAVMALNVGGILEMSEAAYARAFRRAGRGTIVNVTLSPHHGLTGMVHSSAARAAAEGVTRELAARWAGDGVTVVAAAAGHFNTDALQKYPDGGARRRGSHRAAATPRTPGGARLADRAARITARPLPQRLDRDPGRRPRQLVRALAAAELSGRFGRGADRGAPPCAALDWALARAWCSGNTGAFQAPITGSSPVARSPRGALGSGTTGSGAVW